MHLAKKSLHLLALLTVVAFVSGCSKKVEVSNTPLPITVSNGPIPVTLPNKPLAVEISNFPASSSAPNAVRVENVLDEKKIPIPLTTKPGKIVNSFVEINFVRQSGTGPINAGVITARWVGVDELVEKRVLPIHSNQEAEYDRFIVDLLRMFAVKNWEIVQVNPFPNASNPRVEFVLKMTQ